MSALISVIIPVHNAAASLARCLDSVNRSTYRNFECLVVDDGSSDDPAAVAAKSGARALATDGRSSAAHARNRGAGESAGGILVFIDADVTIQPDTLAHIAKAFEGDPRLDALIGSYDHDPAAPNFLSQYKNLMHCFVHQHGRRRANTFWTGCGAIRRSVFTEFGWFDESYPRATIEDIELGARLVRAGRTIELDPTLTVKHWKRWTFLALLRSDILDRAIPWTRLILRERHIPNDLNVEWSQRISVVLMYLTLLAAPFCWPASLAAVSLVIALNQRFYRFLARRRGAFFVLRSIPLHLLYFLYSGAAFAVGCLLALIARPKAGQQPRIS